MNLAKTVAMLLGACVVFVASGEPASAAQGNSPVGPVRQTKTLKPGVRYLKLSFSDGTQFGIAQVLQTKNQFHVLNIWRLEDAPTSAIAGSNNDVQANFGATTVRITLIGEDDLNLYYQAEWPDGAITLFSVNKESGDVTVIGTQGP